MKTDKRLFAGIIAVLALLHSVEPGRTAPRAPQPPWPEESIKIFGFDSGYARGPWRNLALNEDNATLLESWSGYALSREASRESFLPVPVIIPALAAEKEMNFAPAAGVVRCWFAANWSTAGKVSGGQGPGHAARLLELVDLNGKKAKTRWSLFFNAAGDTLFLAGETKLGAAVVLQAPVEFVAGDWRLISLCYSETNVVLQLDTATIAQAGGLAAPAAWEEKDLGLVIGSDVYASADSLAEGQFDEVVTKRRWPTKMDWQEMYFNSGKRRSWLGAQGTKEEEQAKVVALKSIGLLPEEYGMASQSLLEGGGTMAYSYAEGSLWLGILSVTNGQANLIVHGTEPEAAYEILSKETLTNSTWAGELPIVLGAAGQDWTAATVAIGARTNSLFLWARVLRDTDGDGLPDWWELEHGLDPNNPDTGNTGVPDGYKDSDNDGWTNLQEYQNGTSPGLFNTPPPPRNVTARLDATGTTVIMTWESGGGPVASYEIGYYQFFPITQNISPTTHTATFELDPFYVENLAYDNPSVAVRARFPDNSSATSLAVTIKRQNVQVYAVRGANCNFYLVPQALSAGVERIRFGYSLWDSPGFTPWFDLYPTNLSNGSLRLPLEQRPAEATIYYECIFADGSRSEFESLGFNTSWEDWSSRQDTPRTVFVDARPHLKENLRFLLRAATATLPFSYTSAFLTDSEAAPVSPAPWFTTTPETYFARTASSTEYEYSGYRNYSYYYNHCLLLSARPVWEHYYWRNFVFDSQDFTASGIWTNGAGYNGSSLMRTLNDTAQYRFGGDVSNSTAPPLAFDGSSSAWLYFRNVPFDLDSGVYPESVPEVGLSFAADLAYLAANTRNCYGLFLNSLRVGLANVYYPGNLFVLYDTRLFPEYAQPQLQTEGYYFASQTARLRYGPRNQSGILLGDPTPLPGTPNFSVTNVSPALITGVGQQILVSGWAKQAIVNGYANKFAYLEQYFDQAFTTTNGVVTTNETGVLSPYGEFFPTEPGRTALVTLPDIETGERGTATVYVVSMNLDANHDGIMDRTFFGPDQTSATKPFRFWVNNDYDVSSGTADLAGHEGNPQYRINSSDPGITCQRDLEDFARLWICGMPALTNGYQVTLSMNALSGNPAINIVNAVETNGGTLYLTDSNTAYAQVWDPYGQGPGQKRPTISATNALTLSANLFTNSGNKYFLFEGRGIGSGELVLTIRQGTNVLAQTSAWLDVRDVKDMFEHAHIEGVLTTFPSMRTNSTSTSTFKIDNQPDTASDDAKQLIVLAHGWNNSVAQAEIYAQTMFKRLYWAGYQGRFAALRWPTLSGETDGWLSLLTYNRSEYIAFRSAAGVSAYFNSLRSRFPDYSINAAAHSMGNIVMMEALRLQAASGSNALNNYVLMEAAVPAHCYDTNAPLCPGLFTEEFDHPTPNTYFGYPGAVTNALRGKIFNFFNTNDLALAAWVGNQLLQKPEGTLGYQIIPPLQPHLVGTLITDPREIMAFCARPRSYAMGAQPGVHGMIVGTEVDLNARFGFDRDAADHSGQYTRTIHQVRGFYSTFLEKLDESQP